MIDFGAVFSIWSIFGAVTIISRLLPLSFTDDDSGWNILKANFSA